MAFQDGPGDHRVEPRFESMNGPGAEVRPGPDQPASNLRGKLFGALVAFAAVVGFVGIAWYATTQGQRDSSIVVPMIRADNSPVKVLPAKPGGMKVPNQDKLIFMQVTPGQKKPTVERLLPPPEKPMAKPAPPPEQSMAKSAKTPPSGPMVPDSGTLVSRPASPQPRAPLRPEPAPSSAKAPPKVPAAKPKPVKRVPKAVMPVPKIVKRVPKVVKPVPKVKKSAKVAVSGKTPAAVPVRSAFHVQLGAVKTKVRAAKEAGRLARVHKPVLSRLTVRAVRANLGKRGIFYRLRAGPLANRAAAAALCAKLKARKQGCIVVKP